MLHPRLNVLEEESYGSGLQRVTYLQKLIFEFALCRETTLSSWAEVVALL